MFGSVYLEKITKQDTRLKSMVSFGSTKRVAPRTEQTTQFPFGHETNSTNMYKQLNYIFT